MDVDTLRAKLREASALQARGRVTALTGLSLRFVMPGVRTGDVVTVLRRGEPLDCEVVGFDGGEALALPLGELHGIGPDDAVQSHGAPLQVRAHDALLGRVLDGLGRPLDGLPELARGDWLPIDRAPPEPLRRAPITRILPSGVRAIDALLTLGEGQRIGLFAGSGVGKSALLGALARGAHADVVVLALIGERGREVGEFLQRVLCAQTRSRCVTVVASSSAPALVRLRAAQIATTYAEHFRDQGAKVLLLLDSLTRCARAQREVGLAAGEPPTRRGYPPSVFAMLPRLLERSGQGEHGSITAVYTVLVEGGDLDEPIADEVRGLLDGHIVLDRTIAARGRYPAIDVLASLSRVMPAITAPEQQRAAHKLRQWIAAYEQKRDLIQLGVYTQGSDAALDLAIQKQPLIENFLQQDLNEIAPFEQSLEALHYLLK